MFLRIAVILFSACSWLFAQSPDWQTITNQNNVKDISAANGSIWVASDGGLYEYLPGSGVQRSFDNLNGLVSVDLQATAANNESQLIVGSADGFLQLYDPAQQNWLSLYDFDNLRINKILSRGDTLFVAAGTGLGVFLRRGGDYFFNDYLQNFPVLFNSLNDIALHNNRIWLASDAGLLSAPADFVRNNLTDPQNWTLHNSNSSVSQGVLALHALNGVLWLANSNGLYKVSDGFTAQDVDRYQGLSIDKLGQHQNKLLMISENTYRLYDVNADSEELYNTPADITAAQSTGDILFLGLKDGGLLNTESAETLLLPGPGRNAVRYIFNDSRGTVWASTGKYKLTDPNVGFSTYDGQEWLYTYFLGSNWGALGNTDYFYEDRFGTIWIGSWGGGVIAVYKDQHIYMHSFDNAGTLVQVGSEQTTEQIPAVDEQYRGFFSGAPNGLPSYEVITAIKEDAFGRLWFVNAYPNNGQYLAVATYDGDFVSLDKGDWTYFGRNDGISLPNDEGVSCIEFDDFGRVWIGTHRDGLYILDYNNTLVNKSDDQVFNLDIGDNLFGNSIRSLAYDDDGIMWIGTTAGLNSFDGINVYRHSGDEAGLNGPLDNSISQIVVDDYNNKWIATAGGLSILRGGRSAFEEGSWKGYTAENSGLLDNTVHGVYINNSRGEAWLGTESGISVLRGTFAQIRADFSELSFGPNPYDLKNGQNFTVVNLMNNSTVKIFDLNGRLIRELTVENRQVDGSRAVWDGRDYLGNRVSSGIYLFMAYTADGQSKAAKFAVIR